MKNGLVFDGFDAEFLKIVLEILEKSFGDGNFVDPQGADEHVVSQIVQALFN